MRLENYMICWTNCTAPTAKGYLHRPSPWMRCSLDWGTSKAREWVILISLGIHNTFSGVVVITAIYARAPCMLHFRFLIITQGPNPTWRGMGLLVAFSLSSKKPGQELKGTWQRQERKQSLRGGYPLSCFPWLAQLHFLCSPGPPYRGGPAHSGLGSPTSVINPEDTLQTCPLNWGSFFPDDPKFFQVDKN